jgi:glycosyltransferase involved in cell wall biosynthesis
MPFTRTVGGGSFVSAALLARGLTDLGYRVVALFPAEGISTRLFRNYGIAVVVHDFPAVMAMPATGGDAFSFCAGSLKLLFKARRYLKNNHFSIIHCNDDTSLVPWGLAARLNGIPCVWHVRQGRRGASDPLREKIADMAVCISDFVSQRLSSTMNKVTIYNPVDLQKFVMPHSQANAKFAIGVAPESFVLIQIGRDIAAKRPEWSLHALEALRGQGIDAKLIMLGDYSEKRQADLMMRISPVNYTSVLFPGWVDTPEAYLAASDLLLHPAQEEPFGRIFIEAAACGVPVVATHSGAAPEIVLDGQTGFLAAPRNLEDFCRKTVSLAKDSEKRAQMSACATAHACKFSIAAHAAKTDRAYHMHLQMTFRGANP